MKLIIHTPVGGDWTVVQDEDGNEIYSGHRSWDDLTSAVLGFANPLCDLVFVEYSDERVAFALIDYYENYSTDREGVAS